MPKVKIGDINMYYETRGDGKPLILIAGLGMDLSMWSTESEISKKYKVIMLDNRGAGRTDKPDTPYSIEMMAEDTIGFMDKLGIKHAHIMGCSMGGAIAQTIAAKHPERVNGLILHVTYPKSPDKDDPQVAAMFEQLHAQAKQPGFMDTLGKYPPTIDSFIRQFDALVEFDGTEQLSKIEAPTIIVNGKNDISNPIKNGEELESGINNSKLILVDGDHFVLGTNPESVINHVLDFLEEIGAKSDLEAKSTI
jgi:pimeloyl-ACP methyl ester carboxylesterase